MERSVRELLGRYECRGGAAARLIPFRHQEHRKPLRIMLFLFIYRIIPPPPKMDLGGGKGMPRSSWAGVGAMEVLHGSCVSDTKNVHRKPLSIMLFIPSDYMIHTASSACKSMAIAPPWLWGMERDIRELLGRCGCRGGAVHGSCLSATKNVENPCVYVTSRHQKP